MGKTRIGSIKQKILIEGDVNLLEDYEILVTSDEHFGTILKEKSENGIKTLAVLEVSALNKRLEEVAKAAYDEGYKRGIADGGLS